MQTIDCAHIPFPASLLESLKHGETIAVLDKSRTLAFIVPGSPSTKSRPFGCAKGEFTLADDFNDPDPEVESLFYGTN